MYLRCDQVLLKSPAKVEGFYETQKKSSFLAIGSNKTKKAKKCRKHKETTKDALKFFGVWRT